ncbi:MAG: helix-turn-helix transcriptional regulator [Deltaproteobacteria bacterium]|nr:helix-turn-helix transcriptional regulator [Deltaproteobacteria bacterium]
MIEVDAQFLGELGKRIAWRRKELGLTQTELAAHFSCSQSMMAAYEQGIRRLPVTFLPKLASVLNVTITELLGCEEKAEPPKKRGPTPRLQERFERVQELPRAQQNVVLKMLDGLLEAS